MPASAGDTPASKKTGLTLRGARPEDSLSGDDALLTVRRVRAAQFCVCRQRTRAAVRKWVYGRRPILEQENEQVRISDRPESNIVGADSER